MANYGVPLMTLTERDAPNGGKMLTGRLGHAVVIGLPMEVQPGYAPRWTIRLVEPNRTGLGSLPRHEKEAALAVLATRAATSRTDRTTN